MEPILPVGFQVARGAPGTPDEVPGHYPLGSLQALKGGSHPPQVQRSVAVM